MCDIVGNKRVKKVECGLMCLQALVEGQRRQSTGNKIKQGIKDFGGGFVKGVVGG